MARQKQKTKGQSKKDLTVDFKKKKKKKAGDGSSTRTAAVIQAAGLQATGAGGHTTADAVRLPNKQKGRTFRNVAVADPGQGIDAMDTVGLTIQPHADLRKGLRVKLAPGIRLTGGRISEVAFGTGRTPSPLGTPMGDHTVSWTALTDSVRSHLHGKTVGEAVTELKAMQAAAGGWMADPDSPGMRLFGLVEGAEGRRAPLENYAFEVANRLARAEAVLQGQQDPDGLTAEQLLSGAVAHHLAYRNFLPFATVPAAGVIGSKADGEAHARAAVLAYERALADDEDVPWDVHQAAEAGLWGLFDFEAALRESQAESLLGPKKTQETITKIARTRELAAEVKEMLDGFVQGPLIKGGPRRQPGFGAAGAEDFRARAEQIVAELDGLMAADLGYPDMHSLAAHLRQTTEWMRTTGALEPEDVEEADADNTTITRLDQTVDTVLSSLASGVGRSADDVALVLANLVRDHQIAVRAAYPRTVDMTGFLSPSAEMKAANALQAKAVEAFGEGGVEREARLDFLQRFAVQYASLGPLPPGPAPNRWFDDPATAQLLVSFTDDRSVVIQGRPPAPVGVSGMGSHTTAWVSEVKRVEELVRRHGKGGIVKALRKEVRNDLRGPLLGELGTLLPADQLAGGQLGELFDRAQECFSTTDPDAAVGAYLAFRNLLPYATVDPGDRTGQGMRRTSPAEDLFDAESMALAAELKADEFGPDQIEGTLQAMRDAADSLQATLNDAMDDFESRVGMARLAPSWFTIPGLHDAVTSTITHLRQTATALTTGPPPDPQNLQAKIIRLRQAEHERVTTPTT